MNFLSSIGLVRCSSFPLWPGLSGRDACLGSSLLSARHQPRRPSPSFPGCPSPATTDIQILQTNFFRGSNPYQTCRPTRCTQIRFNKGYPRFHRDLEFPNFDDYRKKEFVDVRKTRWGQGDDKAGYTYVVGWFGWVVAMYGLKGELIHFVSSMSAAADVLALAQIEVDLTKVAPGGCISLKWRGKPLFVKHRSQADIDFESGTPMSALKDPETIEARTSKPEWLVVIGICTHLGCVPIPNSGDWAGGFYCPCHGSHYDNAGRIRKGPAPLNLEVPPYTFISDTLILVG